MTIATVVLAANPHRPEGGFAVDAPMGAWRTCPSTGRHWFEPDGAPARFCPACGAEVSYVLREVKQPQT